MIELKQLMLGAPRLTLALAESMTCGQVQARIGAIPGASEFFLGGITAYSLEQKVRHLGVDRTKAKRVNCVSAEVAAQMACGACALFESDLAISTSGYAEPSSADGVIDPFAWWALFHRRGKRVVAQRSGRIECVKAKRIQAQAMVADAVLAELLAYLREVRG